MDPSRRVKTEARNKRLLATKNDCLARMSDAARQAYLEDLGPQLHQRSEDIFRWCGYECKPVRIEKFISDPFFLGRSLKGNIYPAIIEDLVEIFEGDYIEICLGGSIGWGKTWEIAIGIAYEIYQLSCLQNPALAYGLIPGSTLAFMNVSVDERQARKVLFTNLFRAIQNSPYFQRICPYARNLRREIYFPTKNITCYAVAANEQAILGEGVYSAAFDELNFMATVEKSRRTVPGESGIYDQAQVITNKLSARIRSRFNDHGKPPGHLWYSSSARYPNDFTERKEAEAKTDPTIFVRHRALWESKPRSFFLPESFKIEVGDVTRRTRVLDGTETDVLGEVIEVPMDFYREFVKDPDKSVRDLAGHSVLSVTPFIPRREMIRRMFELGTQAGLQHPFSKIDEQGHPLDVTLQEANAETEVLLPERLHWVERQKMDDLGRKMWKDAYHTQPELERILWPGLYYAHVDLAKNRDASGLVVCHVVGVKKCERMDESTLQMVYETLPVVRVDLALRIIAPPRPGGEIDIPKIRALIHQLRDKVGMQFGFVSFDQFQSQESLKSLCDAGFTADIYSVDKDTEAYDQLKQALYDERLLCYEFPKLRKELAELERADDKVDHPATAGSSKDIADCLAAAYHHAEEGWRSAAGSLNLFKIGPMHPPPQTAKSLFERACAKVTDGQPLTADEENAILWGESSNYY